MFIKSIEILMGLNLVKINYLNSLYYININQNSELFGVVYSNFPEKDNRNIIPQQKRIKKKLRINIMRYLNYNKLNYMEILNIEDIIEIIK
ncbi:MAG: hypothetical protein WC996_09360 [Peptostreptococcales bacterium]